MYIHFDAISPSLFPSQILTKTDVTNSVNKNNADHAVLFESVNLIVSQGLDGDPRLRSQVCADVQMCVCVRGGIYSGFM